MFVVSTISLVLTITLVITPKFTPNWSSSFPCSMFMVRLLITSCAFSMLMFIWTEWEETGLSLYGWKLSEFKKTNHANFLNVTCDFSEAHGQYWCFPILLRSITEPHCSWFHAFTTKCAGQHTGVATSCFWPVVLSAIIWSHVKVAESLYCMGWNYNSKLTNIHLYKIYDLLQMY